MNKLTVTLLVFFSLLSLFFNLYKKDTVPLCLNADEASFGYNAYSILKTGRDEYGTLLPLRLKSFGDYKLPLYSYLSIPFIAISGLNDSAVKLPNTFIAILFPWVLFFLTKKLFKNNSIAIIAAFLGSVSLSLQIMTRQAHEAYLASFLTILASIFFIQAIEKPKFSHYFLFSLFIFLSLFTYHSSRIYAIFFLLFLIFYCLIKTVKNNLFLKLFLVFLAIFAIIDFIYKPTRVQNLLIFNNDGFNLKVQELKTEGGIRILNHQIVNGIRDIALKYTEYFSPQFMLLNGDANPRFGYIGMSILTPIEYLFIFIGIYFLFRNKEKYRFFLSGLFLVAPLSASLAWTDLSITRSLFIFVISLILSVYGLIHFLNSIKNKRYFLPTLFTICASFFFFLSYNWNFYLFHYPKRAIVTQAWQCGYKELADYINENYNSTNKFYITKKNGQPYIFLLFYQKYSPDKYQKIAKLSPPDEYGFGQVEAFDKYIFDFKIPKDETNYITVGYPDDFTSLPEDQKIPENKIKKIIVNNQEIFWIYQKN